MTNLSVHDDARTRVSDLPPTADIRSRIRNYIIDNLLLGTAEDVDDAGSLTKNGIIDSTGTLELVAFLTEEFAITITDKDLIPANLDSVNGMVSLVLRKMALV